MTTQHGQRGLGLVELMVSIVISLIVMAGTIFVFIGNSESSLFHLRATRIVQQMRDTLDRMVVDLRRAGYLGYRYVAATQLPPDGNVFSDYADVLTEEIEFDTDDRVLKADAESVTAVALVGVGGSCVPVDAGDDPDRPGESYALCPGIVYSYNLDDDPIAEPVANAPKIDVPGGAACGTRYGDDGTQRAELFGFLVKDGVLWTRVPVPGATCAMEWVAVTDPNVVTIGDLGTGLSDRAGFALFERCIGIIDKNGTGDRDFDGDVDCEDLDAGDVEIRGRVAEIRFVGRSVRDPEIEFRLHQVVDLPNVTSIIL